MTPDHPEPPQLLGTPVAPEFAVSVVTVQAGTARPYDESEWRGALVVVDRGAVELEFRGGQRRRFGRGDVLWLQGLSVRALHCQGAEPAVLLAISRR